MRPWKVAWAIVLRHHEWRNQARAAQLEHPLLEDGSCRNRTFGYFTRCITTSESFLQQCYASICSLLVTTDPVCVIVYVNPWVYKHFRQQFIRSGVSIVVAPEYAQLPATHPYANLTGSAGDASWNRFYTFTKLEAARLIEHKKVLAFDPDVIFMRNASGVEQLEADFAAARIPKGKNHSQYINNGVMLLKPSLKTYSDLMVMWRAGTYKLYYSNDENGDQDVFTELCWIRDACGVKLDLDSCLYSHGSWLPGDFWRPCPSEKVVARHNFKKAREESLTKSLAQAFNLGACRKSIIPDARTSCFATAGTDEWGQPFTFERCCEATLLKNLVANYAMNGLFIDGGDAECWDREFTYENCCLTWNTKTDELHGQLLRVGAAWYGLSSVPDETSETLLDQQCTDEYARRELTMVSLSIHPNAADDWRFVEAERFVFYLQYKCNSIGGRFVMFNVKWDEYFTRHHIEFDRRHFSAMRAQTACVPVECCSNQKNEHGLHSVLWRFVTAYVFRFSAQDVLLMPVPTTEDYIFTLTRDVSSGDNEWRSCKREI